MAVEHISRVSVIFAVQVWLIMPLKVIGQGICLEWKKQSHKKCGLNPESCRCDMACSLSRSNSRYSSMAKIRLT